MTERLYFQNPYETNFKATVVQHVQVSDQPAVVLDRTHFYPTSGGQPNDLGTINQVAVLDVLTQSDGSILHLLADEIEDDQVYAEIDWPRRFDHMQQHTGQHILSASFEKVANAETIGFHLGTESSTIDLNVDCLNPDLLNHVESLANKVIFADHQIHTTFVSHAQANNLPLRKDPETFDNVRIVEIEQFDLAACGGTHVSRTGELGLVKIVKVDHRGRGLRVEFLCGRRALEDYGFKSALVTKLSNSLSVGKTDLESAVDRLHQETKTLRSALRKATEKLLEYEIQELYQKAESNGDVRIVQRVFVDRDRREINWLSKNLTSESGVVVLLGVAGEKSHLLFARSTDIDHDMRPLLQTALQALGSTSGGGRPEMAQGGGPEADEKRVELAINHAKRSLLTQIS
jgi:alanyl-tRNA synthetase